MKKRNIQLPFSYRAANSVGKLLQAAGISSLRLDEETLAEMAKKRTGLSDFGDPYYREGLLKLLESAENDANLHPLGRYMTNEIVTNYLVQRLYLTETRKTSPEIFEQPLRPPIIIVGMARSGTTFLHRLLSVDPNHRALPQWLLMRPFPEPNEERDRPDPRLEKMKRSNRFILPMVPGIDAIHYSRPETPEECMFAFGLTFNSLIFGTLLPVYSYIDWYTQQENTLQKYTEYSWLLQVFQSKDPAKRFTLKAPVHTGHLHSIVQTLPDAMIVQTHRDPVTCVSSVCSLLYTYHLAVSKQVDIKRMAHSILDLYEVMLKRNIAFREKNPGRVYDVFFKSFVKEPVKTTRDIYRHFGLAWDQCIEAKVNEYVQNNAKEKHGKHTYSAEDFGLSEGMIRERLQFYSDHFDLSH